MSQADFVALCSIAHVDSGPAFKSSMFGEPGDGIRLVRGDNIEPGLLRWTRTKTWPESELAGYEHLVIEADDLILGMDRPVISAGLKLARVRPADLPALLVQRVARIRPHKVESDYLYHWLSSPKFARHLEATATGTQLPHVTLKSIREYPVPRFTAEEERRIVDLLEDNLSRLDAADREVVRTREKLDALWRSALKATRESFSATPRAIGDIASTSLGKMLDAKKKSGELIPYLRNINVRWGSFDLGDLQTTPLEPNEVAKFDVREGDIMVCEGGEPGRCAVWRGDGSGLAFQKALHRIRIGHQAEVLPNFLALMLEECIRSGRADRMFTGTTIRHLPQEKLRTIEIVLPSLDDQQAALQHLVVCNRSLFRVAAVHAAPRRVVVGRRCPHIGSTPPPCDASTCPRRNTEGTPVTDH